MQFVLSGHTLFTFSGGQQHVAVRGSEWNVGWLGVGSVYQ